MSEWLVSSLPGEAKKQLVFSVFKEIAFATGSAFWFLGGLNASQRPTKQPVGSLPSRPGQDPPSFNLRLHYVSFC